MMNVPSNGVADCMSVARIRNAITATARFRSSPSVIRRANESNSDTTAVRSFAEAARDRGAASDARAV